MSRPTVLITGAGGLIGAALVPALLQLDYAVDALDRDASRLGRFATNPDAGRLRMFPVDIIDPHKVADVVITSRPTAIVHLAALHLIPDCEAEPRRTVETNINGLVNVLDAAEHAQTKFVLFASTADVYTASAEALAESDTARPSTAYGTTKLLGERLVAEWARRQPDRRATSLRIFNVYGPGDRNPHVLPDILNGLKRGDDIQVGNTEARRDFVHADDLADLLCQVLASDHPPALLNAGTGVTTSIAELLGILQKLLDRPFAWKSDAAKVRANDRDCLRADVSRLRSEYPNFAPRNIETGLADVLTALGMPVSER